MKIEQINHWLTKVFIVALVLLQGALFVSTRAAFTNVNQLQIQFILSSDSFTIGEQVLIQANISNDYDFNTVHFIIRDSDNLVDLEFQAILENDNIWVADSLWDTIDLMSGIYYLSASASAYDSQGNMIEFATSNDYEIVLEEDIIQPLNNLEINIISPVANEEISGQEYEVIISAEDTFIGMVGASLIQDSEELDQQYFESFGGTYQYHLFIDTTLASNAPAQLLIFEERSGTMIDLADINVIINNQEDVEPQVIPLAIEEIVHPNPQDVISGTDGVLEVRLNRVPSDPINIIANLYSLTDGQLIENYELLANNDNSLIYQGNLGDTNVYPDGEYYIVFELNNLATEPIVFTIQNTIEEDEEDEEDENNFGLVTDPVDYTIALQQPVGSSIETDEFVVELTNNFLATNLGFLFTKADDPSIGQEFVLVYTNGQYWSQLVAMDDTFINGQYLLTVVATDANDEIAEEVFNLELNRVIYQQPDPPEENEESDEPPAEEEESDDNTPSEPAEEEESDEPPAEEEESDDNTPSEPAENEVVDPFVCQTDIDCVNLCAGCYNQNYLPENDCAAIPTGSCACMDNQCVHIEEASQIEPMDDEDISQLCLDNGIEDIDNCVRWLAVSSGDIDPLCLAEDIYDPIACEDYLNRTYVDLECQVEQIIDVQACQDYLLEKYASDVACNLSSVNLCQQILQETYLNRLVVKQKQKQAINEIIDPIIGQTVSAQDVMDQLVALDVMNAMPLKEDVKVLIVSSEESITLVSEQKLEMISPAVLVIDTDSDGLPDDLENYYGTDILNPDTDSDGYLDGQEINNNYNPLGEGELLVERTNLDKIILSATGLEQPKSNTDKLTEDFEVYEVVNNKEEEKIVLSGQADANAWILIYLYSDLPLVLTTQVDANGNWSYTLDENLVDGQHQAYVTVNDDTGKIIKQSNPLSFFVSSAQAVSAGDYFTNKPVTDRVDNMVLYYLLGGAALILVSLGVIVFIHRAKDDLSADAQDE